MKKYASINQLCFIQYLANQKGLDFETTIEMTREEAGRCIQYLTGHWIPPSFQDYLKEKTS